MQLKKTVAAVTLPLLLCSFLFSQNLAELAKKEKERREKLKGKKSLVVTNADLARLKKKASVIVLQSIEIKEERFGVSDTARKSLPKGSDKGEFLTAPSDLEERWMRAKEQVELLTLKINALWQEFYSLDDSTSQENVQRKIDEASLDLQKARQDEEKLKKELERLRKK
jgi:hypothetical protein